MPSAGGPPEELACQRLVFLNTNPLDLIDHKCDGFLGEDPTPALPPMSQALQVPPGRTAFSSNKCQLP